MPRGGRKPLRGYRRLHPADGRGYITPNGRIISEYEYRSRVARKQGWKNAYQSDKYRRSESWSKWKADIENSKGNFLLDVVGNYKLGKHGKPIYIGPDLSYKGETMYDAYVVRQREIKGEVMIPDGPETKMDETELGRLLILTGRRPADAFWVYPT